MEKHCSPGQTGILFCLGQLIFFTSDQGYLQGMDFLKFPHVDLL